MMFDELLWHDAQLLAISIDRGRAGLRDEVSIDVCWPDETASRVTFLDCYGFFAQMNFGVVGEDTILAASEVLERDDIAQVREKWGRVGVSLKDIKCYELETSSTASIIRIYAHSCRVT